jgi:hypothetical protein
MAAKKRKEHKKDLNEVQKVSNVKNLLFLRFLRFFAAIKPEGSVSLRLSIRYLRPLDDLFTDL